MTDLAVALTLGALTGFQRLHVTPSAAPITELPLALIPSAGVPLLLALHITSLGHLRGVGRAWAVPAGRRRTPRPGGEDAQGQHGLAGVTFDMDKSGHEQGGCDERGQRRQDPVTAGGDRGSLRQ